MCMTAADLHPPIATNPRGANWFGVAVIVLVVAVAAAIGARVTAPAVENWYPELPKPSWTPPVRIFAPVWMLLYTMMAVAAAIVWVMRDRGGDVCCPLGAFGVQLLLNVGWSVLFFGLKSPLLGFLDICLLWIATGATATQFFLVSRPAGWLMAPYWACLTFAVVLNAAILLMGG
jgi:tryptophan-rich sensory protein